MASQSHSRTKVFISYSHKDRAWLERLHVHLKPLERENRVAYWDDTKIKPGTRWREEIAQALAVTKVAVLLVSADFLASDFIESDELPPLLNAAANEGTIILPLILSPSRFERVESLSQFQVVNYSSKPLAALPEVEQEAEFLRVSEVIEYCLGHSPAAGSGWGEVPGLRPSDRHVMMPGFFRYVLDSCWPSLHRRLTVEVGLFKVPPEWYVFNEDLKRLRDRIERDIKDKTYIDPPVKDVPEDAKRKVERAERTDFFTPIQQVIKEIRGISKGGDAQSAQISAISRKSKFVRNIVKRLLKAEEPLILLGDPGMGKTFTLQQAARRVAVSEGRRVFPKLCLFFSMGKFQMPAVDTAHLSEEELNKRREEAVWSYVRKVASPEVRPYLRSLAASRRLVIFFDGMDEMSRGRYNDYTEALSFFAGKHKGDVKTLFSCRITDFTPTFQHYRLVLLPFTRKLIEKYLEWWFGDSTIIIGGEEWTAKRLAKWLAQDTLPIQATNPFVLRMLCEYIEDEQNWPRSRVQLFEYYAYSKYAKEETEAAREGRSMPPADDAFLVLGRLAYELTERNMGTDIPRGDLDQFLDAKELLSVDAGKDCGVLLEAVDVEATEPVKIRFEHHRFQEFFTAYYLKNTQLPPSLNWLDKLDAPRWQETLFNLVMMDGGGESLAALVKAIRDGVDDLSGLKGLKKPADAENPFADIVWEDDEGEKSDEDVKPTKEAQPDDPKKIAEAALLETLLADRVELASRILQQTWRQQPGEGRDALLSAFQLAVNWLAEHGNPITKVKMLLAARIVPETDIWGIAHKVRSSEVAWVHQQARTITWATDRKVEAGELQEKDPTLSVQGELTYSFASGLFLKRFLNYASISLGLKRRGGLWLVLALGFILCLAQLLAGYAVVVAARAALIPAYSMTEQWTDRAAQRGIRFAAQKADEPGNENFRGGVMAAHRYREGARQQFPAVADAVQQTLYSWWFLLAAHLTMLVTLLVSLRQAPGQQSFTFQTAGYVCLFLPVTLQTLWLGTLGNDILLVLFLLLCVPVVRAVGWVVTLPTHALTLMLFSAGTFGWTKRRVKTLPLLASMWENAGFKSWGKDIKGGLSAILIPLGLIAIAVLSEVDWVFVRVRLSWALGQVPPLPPALMVVFKFFFFGLAFVACIAFVTRLLPWVREKEWRADLQTRWEGVHGRGAKLKYGSLSEDTKGCLGCAGSLVVLGLIVRVWSLVNWQAVWDYMLSTFGLFPSAPPYANIALSVVAYAEAAGCLLVLVVVLARGRKDWNDWGIGLGYWTLCCSFCALVLLAIWGIASLESETVPGFIFVPLGAFLSATLNLFRFLPIGVNRLLSLAVYVEIIGCLVGLAAGLRKTGTGWEQMRKVIRRTTRASLIIVAVTFLLWGVVLLLGFLGSSIYDVAISGRLGQVLVFLIMLTLLVWAGSYLTPLTEEMVLPYLKIRRNHAETKESWKQQFDGLDPNTQAILLKQVRRKMFNKLSDQEVLQMLEEIQNSIEEEPARSAYWEKRFEFEQITRQHRVG